MPSSTDARFTDEVLVAYADGELPAAEAKAVAEAARSDAVLAQRIGRFTESRRILQDRFAQHLRAPVPQRLLDVLQAESGAATVTPRVRRERWQRTGIPVALAASLTLAVGLAIGIRFGPPRAAVEVAGLPSDTAALQRALDAGPSGGLVRGADFEIVPTASLRTEDGRYCREFESAVFSEQGRAQARGLACRSPAGSWQTIAVTSTGADAPADAGGTYVPAAGAALDLSTALGAAVRLTPAQEQELIRHHWQEP